MIPLRFTQKTKEFMRLAYRVRSKGLQPTVCPKAITLKCLWPAGMIPPPPPHRYIDGSPFQRLSPSVFQPFPRPQDHRWSGQSGKWLTGRGDWIQRWGSHAPSIPSFREEISKSNKASYDDLWLSGPVDALKMAAVCLEIMATLESFEQ